MRYDAETHRARAAMLSERAAMAECPRQRLKFLSHAIIAVVLAKIARQHASGALFVYLEMDHVDDSTPVEGRRWHN